MDEVTYWTKFGAIAQALGAVGTFAAVVVSLVVAFRARKPSLRITVGERIVVGEAPTICSPSDV